MPSPAPAAPPLNERLPPWAPAVALALVSFVLYALCSARTIQGADAAEFMSVAAVGGVPHPPGYPLQTWAVRLAHAVVPWGTAAFRASLVSAAQAAVGVGLLADAGRRLTRSPIAALLGASIFACSLTIFRYATVAEVFGGVVFTAAAVVWVGARVAGGWRGPAPAVALGLAVASGVANHHTVILTAPLATWAALTLLPRPIRAGGVLRSWGGLALALCTGFLAYLPFLAVRGGWRWGGCTDLPCLADHFLRKDYGTFSLSAAPVELAWYDHLLWFGERLVVDSAGLGAALALLGAVLVLRRASPARTFWWMLAASWLLAGPLFMLEVNLSTDLQGLPLALRFHVLPATLAALFVTAGVQGARELLRPALRRPLLAALGLAVLGLAARAVPRSGHQSSLLLDSYLRGGLQRLPPDAMLVGKGDEFLFGMLYLQAAEGVRPDVLVVDELLMPLRWYRDWLIEQHPDDQAWIDGLSSSLPQLALEGRQRRPTYLVISYWTQPEKLEGVSPVAPEGGWLRVFDPGGAPPSPWQVAASLEQVLLDDHIEPPTPRELKAAFEARDNWALEQYAFSYLIAADAMERLGDVEGADRATRRGLELAPWIDPEH